MNLKVLDTYQSSFSKKNQWIEELKFSPDSSFLAFGGHGGASKVEVCKVTGKKLKKYGRINAGLTSALLHLDWDESSSQIVINSQAYELKFVDIHSKTPVRASSCRDTPWYSWTCKLGFPVQGIFPGVDGTDVNTVDRSQNSQLLATGDDFQLVKIFKYPSVVPKSGFKSYRGHASHVTRVRFLLNDKYLISTGGLDKTSIIWKTSIGEDEADFDEEEEFVHQKKRLHKYEEDDEKEELSEERELKEGAFDIEMVEETEFMAVKPWLGAIRAPSNYTGSKYD